MMTVYFYSFVVKDEQSPGDISSGHGCMEVVTQYAEDMNMHKAKNLTEQIAIKVKESTSYWQDSYRVVITSINKL